MPIDWKEYPLNGFFDELIDGKGEPRAPARSLANYLTELGLQELRERKTAADVAIATMGITFRVYTEGGTVDRAWPFDIIPRVIAEPEWRRVEEGLKQRVQALNLFINDLYDKQSIVKDGVLPAELLAQSVNFRPQCVGARPKHGIWAHICGSDLIRDQDGTIYVLEDNLRVPSGVSYMLENREVTKRIFPELFQASRILPVDDYPGKLYEMLAELSPRRWDTPSIVVLTPGIYNSAYFEHAYLAQQMGVQLVEGRDLYVDENDTVYKRTIAGPARVDVIYRRIDDLFLDPEVFDKESMLGVPGLMRAWRAGNVALANAPGAGVADDKVVYAYVPKIIKYYLDEDPIIPNVPTYLCTDPKERSYVLENIEQLVVKPANESGGYGMMVGPKAGPKEHAKFRHLVAEDPRNYIAQPTLNLSTAPCLCGDTAEPRHLDLRPFILSGKKQHVTMGGLTRVAMRRGSLVVNSSQGGGSKDTWIVR